MADENIHATYETSRKFHTAVTMKILLKWGAYQTKYSWIVYEHVKPLFGWNIVDSRLQVMIRRKKHCFQLSGVLATEGNSSKKNRKSSQKEHIQSMRKPDMDW